MPFVNRCGDAPKLQTKTVLPTTSQQIITPDDTYDGLEKIIVSAPVYQTKNVTTDGTVTADEGYSGLSSITVNVPYNICCVETSTPGLSNEGYNGVEKLVFTLGDIMDYHDTNPDRIIVYAAVENAYTFQAAYGVNLHKYSETQYLGYMYLNDPNDPTSSNTYSSYKRGKLFIGEGAIGETSASDHSVKVSYDGSTKEITINPSNTAYKGSNGDSKSIRFVGDNHGPITYKGYFIWY